LWRSCQEAAIRHHRAGSPPQQQHAGRRQRQPDLQRVQRGTWRRRRGGARARRAVRQPSRPCRPPKRAGSNARRRAASDLGIRVVFFTHQREQASPDCIVMATRIAGREVGREGAQEVVCARRGAHGEEEPCTLQVGQQGELLQQPRLFEQPSVGVGGHKPWVPDKSAQGKLFDSC